MSKQIVVAAAAAALLSAAVLMVVPAQQERVLRFLRLHELARDLFFGSGPGFTLTRYALPAAQAITDLARDVQRIL